MSSLVVDAGANLGWYTVVASRLGGDHGGTFGTLGASMVEGRISAGVIVGSICTPISANTANAANAAPTCPASAVSCQSRANRKP